MAGNVASRPEPQRTPVDQRAWGTRAIAAGGRRPSARHPTTPHHVQCSHPGMPAPAPCWDRPRMKCYQLGTR
eukprot:9901737-Alexandrium_andersonii.AAC.1